MRIVTTAAPTAPPAEFPLETRTAPALWRYVLAQGWTTPAYLEERADGWREVSWQEAGERVDALARALLARGVRRGDAVAVLARTRLEWILLDWAIMSIGAVVVGLYPTNTASECAYILAHSEAVLAFVEDEAQREKLARCGRAPGAARVIGFDELPAFEAEARTATRRAGAGARGRPRDAHLHIGHDRPAEGLHAEPQEPRHRRAPRQDAPRGQSDTVLLFLPLAHSFARIVHHSAAFHGATLALVSDATRVPEALARTRPTILPAVPRVYEKIHANTLGEIERASGAKRAIGRWALGVGARASRLRRPDGRCPAAAAAAEDRRQARLLEGARAARRPAAPRRVRCCAARHRRARVLPLAEHARDRGLRPDRDVELAERQRSRRLPLRHGRPRRRRLRAAARRRTARSSSAATPSSAGYYKEPEATAAAFTDDGWFRTGDVGEIDADGWLKITDRKKDLIITAGGKNIAPQNLENALKASRFVSQALIIGDRRPYVTALITLDPAELDGAGRDPQELVQEIVDDVNRDRVRVEQIKRFAILPRDFTQEDGELTPTLKLRRKVVHEHFADEIEQLYASMTAAFLIASRFSRARSSSSRRSRSCSPPASRAAGARRSSGSARQPSRSQRSSPRSGRR